MAEKWTPVPGCTREEEAVGLTRFLLRKHYRESNAAADESIFDEPFFWFGAAEQEFSVDREEVIGLFRRFVGQVPRCNLTEEDFHAVMIAPDVCMVAGRLWVATDPSTGVFLRVHQRITTCVRWREEKPRLCMLHLSNPYVEMTEDDVGFPTEMAEQSREYMRRQLEEQKQKIARQGAELTDIYNTVSCGILRLLRTPAGEYRLLTFNRALAALMDRTEEDVAAMDWSQGFGADAAVVEDIQRLRASLDGLKAPGDRSGADYQIRTGKCRVVYLHSDNDFISREPEGDVIQRLTYDVTERVRLEQALKRLSLEDPLTGLYNRNSFNETMARFRCEPPCRLGAACFDLNGLKGWNDRYGHSAGDALIRRAGEVIAAVFPGKAYRLGGDEFLVLDDEREEADFRAAVRRVEKALEREHISVSAGISWREGGCDARRQADEADRLMYEAKAAFYGGRKQSPDRGR